MTTEMIEAPVEKKSRRGNPLMRSITDEDLTGNKDFVFQKFDALFKGIVDEKLLTAALWKEYLVWRGDAERREKAGAVAKLKAQAEAMGLSVEDLVALLKSS